MHDLIPLALFTLLLSLLAPLLGHWLWPRLEPASPTADMRWLRHLGFDTREQGAAEYLGAVLLFNGLGIVLLALILAFQHHAAGSYAPHPAAWSWPLIVNTAISFVTNTNWQAYAGELQLAPAAQSFGLTVQNFLSAATGLGVLLTLLRGFARSGQRTVGNFYVDVWRGVIYLLLPLSLILALLLVAGGVPQTHDVAAVATPVSGQSQILPLGQVASQVAIKQLGTNGGGFYGVNSAHPFENPSAWTNLLESLAILLIPAALIFTLGRATGHRRHAWLLYLTLLVLVVAGTAMVWYAEVQPDPALAGLASGGHWEGKESRFGLGLSALWSVITTAASNGSVNAMHDSFSALGGAVPLFNLLLGGVIFGGVGSGLYGLLLYALLTAFLAALMIGRSADYLGKRIGALELKATLFGLLMLPIGALGCGALAWLMPGTHDALTNPGAHGVSQWLYAYGSAAGNNGSAFAGFNATSTAHQLLLGVAMLIGRFGVVVPVVLMAGHLVQQPRVQDPVVPADSLLFAVLLVLVLVILGGLSFFPALALGPLAEWLMTGA